MAAPKFEYVIEYPRGTLYYHNAIVNYREESLPLHQIEDPGSTFDSTLVDHRLITGYFEKTRSVFSLWKEDTDSVFDQCL